MSKVIIAGGRDFTDFGYVKGYMATLPPWLDVKEVVCGMAPGADECGHRWAQYNSIPVTKFYADWDKYGKRAGPLRNLQMAEYADGLIAFWDGKSPGTKDMIMQAQQHGLWTYVVRTDIPWEKKFNDGMPILNNVEYTQESMK